MATTHANHDALVKRHLELRREISAQRAAIKRAKAHGEAPQIIARLANTLRRLTLEIDDVARAHRYERRAS